MNRRDFFKSSGAALAYSSLSSLVPLFARAAPSQDQYLLVYEMGGGWDVSLSLDPWTASERPDPSDYFLEYTPNDLFSVGNVIYGPAMSEIKNVLSEFSVIRGVFIAPSDSGHGGALNMMRSGNGGKHPDLLIDFASLNSEQNLGVLSRSALFPSDLKVTTYSIDDLNGSRGQDADSILIKGAGAMARARRATFNLASKFKTFNEMRSQLIGTNTSDVDLQRIASISAALHAGLSNSALFESTLNLDTHSNHEKNHLTQQAMGWQNLAKVVNVLKQTPAKDGQSIFDKTTIVVYSEFSRTPMLNTAKGKDHNPLLNSVLVSGPGFKKGVSVGGSRIVTKVNSKTDTPYHIAVPCDFETGAPIFDRDNFAQGAMISPENLMATIADGMGLDRNIFRCARPTTPGIKAIQHRR